VRLSEINLNSLNIYRDGEFNSLAQCTILTIKGMLSFLSEDKYIDTVLNNQNIRSIICRKKDVNYFSENDYGIIVSDNPKLTFFKIHNMLSNKANSFNSFIDPQTRISESAYISKCNVKIGKNVIIEDNVVIKSNVKIGDNTIIRVGCVIGGQGYEFKKNCNIDILRVNHCGETIIGDNVELKEYVTIHQAVFDWDTTVIDDYCKLDAHTHIGHATKVGKRVMMGSHVNIAGNVKIGNDVYIGPGVTISNRLIIEDNAKISIGSVVSKNVDFGSTVTGNFAIPHESFILDLKSKIKK